MATFSGSQKTRKPYTHERPDELSSDWRRRFVHLHGWVPLLRAGPFEVKNRNSPCAIVTLFDWLKAVFD